MKTTFAKEKRRFKSWIRIGVFAKQKIEIDRDHFSFFQLLFLQNHLIKNENDSCKRKEEAKQSRIGIGIFANTKIEIDRDLFSLWFMVLQNHKIKNENDFCKRKKDD